MAETIRFSQLGRQDIRFGRNQFEVTLASGQTVLLDELDLGYVLANLTGLKTYATVASLPAVDSSNPGRLARVTADGKLYCDNGTAWVAFSIPGGTTGSIPFYTSTGLAEDNSNLFWDDTNNRLGVGVNSSFTERINIPNNSYLGGRNAAASAYRKLIGINASDRVIISESGTDVHVNGPTTFNQNATVATGKTLALTDATTNGILYAPSTKVVTSTSAMTNGQLLIGNTGNAPTLATLTAGDNVDITNGPGTITIGLNGARLYDSDDSTVTVNNTTTETSLYSLTLTGSQFRDHALMIVVGGTYLNDSGANRTLTLNITTNGAASYTDTTAAIAVNANSRIWQLILFYRQNAAFPSTFINGRFTLSGAGAPTTGFGVLSANDTISGTIGQTGVGLSNNLNPIDIRVTHSAANASLTIVKRMGFAMLI